MKRFAFAALLIALLLGGCTVRRSVPTALTAAAPEPSPAAAPQETSAPPTEYTLRYYDGDTLLREERLEAGTVPGAFVPGKNAPFLGWQDASGGELDPTAQPLTGDLSCYAVFGPGLKQGVPYLEAASGIFRPDDALTRREAAMLLYALLPEPPALPEEAVTETPGMLPDAALDSTGMNANTRAYESEHYPTAEENPREESLRQLSALISGGILPPGDEEDPLRSESPVGREALLAALAPYCGATAAESAALSQEPTRLETALWLNALLGTVSDREYAFADLEHGSDAALAASRACDGFELGEGLTLLPCGKLYCIEDGRVLRDADVGTLHFGADGAYTSGSETLDWLCRDAIVRTVNLNDSHERQLRAVYIYARDRFAYLRRNYYDAGAHGWEMEEAETMLSSHYGNCYSYAAAFWALARAVGYDAHAISGRQGPNFSPHGWVWITMEDGFVCFFDVEAEFAALRDGYGLNPMFRMTVGVGTEKWQYSFNWANEGLPV